MKRLLPLILVLILVLCACGNTAPVETTTEPTETTTMPTIDPVEEAEESLKAYRHPLNGTALLEPLTTRPVAVVINNLKGIFFDDDDFEHMSCSIDACWGKIGMTEIRICDHKDLKKCEFFR